MIPLSMKGNGERGFPIFACEAMVMNDGFRHKGLRRRMVEELREKGIDNDDVLAAIGAVPRHLFLDDAFLEYAYQDRAFPIDAGQTISQPFTVALQTSLLETRKGHWVLEVGTGSGYQAAVLSQMRARVISIERQRGLYDRAREVLRELGSKVRCLYGDGYEGANSFAPFDRILVTCGAPSVPMDLLDQLKPEGVLVVPVGTEEQRLKRVVKKENGEWEVSDHGPARFVPMLERKEKGGNRS